MGDDKRVPEHVPQNWIYMNGTSGELCGEQANEIIEEIMVILIKRRITIKTAKAILEDTIRAIEKEAVLGDRKLNGEII